MSKLKYRLSVIGVILGLLVLAGVVVPAIIRGFFYILLQMMKFPLESLVITLIFLSAYSLGVYLGEKSEK